MLALLAISIVTGILASGLKPPTALRWLLWALSAVTFGAALAAYILVFPAM